MTVITKEQKEAQDAVEAMNRKERRNLGKRMKKDMKLSFTPKIPGSQKPYVKNGHNPSKETS